MELKFSSKMKDEVLDILRKYGYESKKDFIEDAIARRILELKRADFLLKVKEIREKMKKRKITEEEILRDFDRFYHLR
jgi:SOS response regulatory protein OraA/RecX